MAFNIGGTTLSSSTITPTSGLFTLSSTELSGTGYVTKGTTKAFSANGSSGGSYSSGWQYPNNTGWDGAGAWQIFTGSKIGWVTDAQRGSDFSTSTGRFTASVAGWYVFSASAYVLNDLASPYNTGSGYIHLQFAKNGSRDWNNGYNPLTIYMYGAAGGNSGANSGYADGATVNGVMQLAVGDYVEMHMYINANTTRVYPQYTTFFGALVG